MTLLQGAAEYLAHMLLMVVAIPFFGAMEAGGVFLALIKHQEGGFHVVKKEGATVAAASHSLAGGGAKGAVAMAGDQKFLDPEKGGGEPWDSIASEFDEAEQEEGLVRGDTELLSHSQPLKSRMQRQGLLSTRPTIIADWKFGQAASLCEHSS